MIEFKTGARGKGVELKVNGTTNELLADVATLICIIDDKTEDAFEVKHGFWLALHDAVNEGMIALKEMK